jgi:hypothetical protein
VQDVTATYRPSSDHGDNRFGTGANLALEIQDIEPHDAAALLFIAGISTNTLIPAGAKGQRSFSGQNDDTDLMIVPRFLQGLPHFRDCQWSERIPDLGAVDRDLGHALGLLVADVGEVSCFLPIGSRFDCFHYLWGDDSKLRTDYGFRKD